MGGRLAFSGRAVSRAGREAPPSDALREALRERVKELTCLYGMARLAERPDLALDDLLSGIVALLPPAWRYPEAAQARVTVGGKAYATEGFREGGPAQRAPIVVRGARRGLVEVAYPVGAPGPGERPFLLEEQSLIETVAREVALIIERREAEEERARLQEQIRHADRLSVMGQLVAGVAHELNEPLGAVLGFAQLAAKCEGVPDAAARDLEKVVEACLHAREVVRRLLLLSRRAPGAGAPGSLNGAVEEALSFLSARFARESVKVALDLSPGLPAVSADAGALRQVLINLFVNALQAMPEGGTLTVATAPAEEGAARLSVSDTGCGMTGDVRERLFLPFFTTKPEGQGTGLGLAVVRDIVTGCGGMIEVESAPGRGTRFDVVFPSASGGFDRERGPDDTFD